MTDWPALPLASWRETCDTLHIWTQVVGKVKLALAPFVNHWWHVTLRVGARGLESGAIPWHGGAFAMTFDFVAHQLRIETSDGAKGLVALRPRSVADFYAEVMATLDRLGIAVTIWPVPVEMPDNTVRFDKDETHGAYDPVAANTFWHVLLVANRALEQFRSSFVGKCSPVHFFWGSFDLAVTRFSGRRAPERPGADAVTREAYSEEVSSAGFWPGGGAVTDAAFYSYAAPEPAGFASAPVLPAEASYRTDMGEFILMYEDVRRAATPEAAVRSFFETTYAAAARLGNWDRGRLERQDDSALPG